jgi:hypothetical protein
MQALMDNQKRMEQKKEKLKRTEDIVPQENTPEPQPTSIHATQSSPTVSSPNIISEPSFEPKSPIQDISSDTVQTLYRQLEEAKQRQKATEMELARLKFEHEEKIIDIQLSLVSII